MTGSSRRVAARGPDQHRRRRASGWLLAGRLAVAVAVAVVTIPGVLIAQVSTAQAAEPQRFDCTTGGGTFTAPKDARTVHYVKLSVSGAGGAGAGGNAALVEANVTLDGGDTLTAAVACGRAGYHSGGTGGSSNTGYAGGQGGGSSAATKTVRRCEVQPGTSPPISICRDVQEALVEAAGGGGAGGGICAFGTGGGAGGAGGQFGAGGGNGGGAEGGDGGSGGSAASRSSDGGDAANGSCSGGGGGAGGGTRSGEGARAGKNGSAGGGGGGGSSSVTTVSGITPRDVTYTEGWNPGNGVVQFQVVMSHARPKIVQHPQNAVRAIGSQVSFEARAVSGDAVSIRPARWEYSTDGGSTWHTMSSATHQGYGMTSSTNDIVNRDVSTTASFTPRSSDNGTNVRAVFQPWFYDEDTAKAFNGTADAASNAATLTVAPDTTITSGPSGLTNEASPSFGFSSDDAAAAFECKVDSPGTTTGTYATCTSPKSFSNLADGGYTFSVRAKDAAGTVDPSPATRSFTVDTTPPDTTITSGPSGATNQTSPSFAFTSTEPGSTFECKVDASYGPGFYAACTSPASFSRTRDGYYEVWVRATDTAGNVDPTPAVRGFTVDTSPPETTIDTGPSGGTNNANPSFGFSSNESGSSFWCNLDGPGTTTGSRAACTSAKSFSNLADGNYTFSVYATDAAGNTDVSPATRSFTVDTTAPDTAIDTGPAEGSWTTSASASFGFSATETGATFGCKLDGVTSYTACSSPQSYTGLALGAHTLSVQATDAVSNIDPSPATRTWYVKAATSLLHNGQQIVNADSTLLLGAKLSSAVSSCTTGQPVTFTLGADPDGDGPATAALGSATTDASGQATLAVSTAGWTIGEVYEVTAAFAGTTTCAPASDPNGTLTVASPGDSARGGGGYTVSGNGRSNFSFVVGKVPNTDPQQYRGRLLFTNNGKWRLKGALNSYAKSGSSASSTGTGDLYHWDGTLNDGLGDWVLSTTGVAFTISYIDRNSGTGGRKSSADQFGIIIDHTVNSPPEPASLPNSSPQDIRSGNIDVK